MKHPRPMAVRVETRDGDELYSSSHPDVPNIAGAITGERRPLEFRDPVLMDDPIIIYHDDDWSFFGILIVMILSFLGGFLCGAALYA